jgi:hypothetical protein
MNATMTVNRDASTTHPLLGDRFAVVREMLSNLDNLSIAGQQHVMAKILGFIEAEAGPVVRRLRARNRLAFNHLLAGLRHESARLTPDVAGFVRGAEAISSLLTALA